MVRNSAADCQRKWSYFALANSPPLDGRTLIRPRKRGLELDVQNTGKGPGLSRGGSVSQPADSFTGMSCVPIDAELRELLNLLATGRMLAADVPPDLLARLRRWGWVLGRERLELTGIGMYRAGSVKRGLLG